MRTYITYGKFNISMWREHEEAAPTCWSYTVTSEQGELAGEITAHSFAAAFLIIKREIDRGKLLQVTQ
jgi:hypothetical protein